MIQQEQEFSSECCNFQNMIEVEGQGGGKFFLEICSSDDTATGTGTYIYIHIYIHTYIHIYIHIYVYMYIGVTQAGRIEVSLSLESIWGPILELSSEGTNIDPDGMFLSPCEVLHSF
jgi:hypothetical protein